MTGASDKTTQRILSMVTAGGALRPPSTATRASPPPGRRWRAPLAFLLLLAWWVGAPAVAQSDLTGATLPGSAQAGPASTVGSGDGRIHLIPALSAPSVKNGGTLIIQAVVTSRIPVARVEARIEREGGGDAPVATVELRPAPRNLGGVNEAGTVGLWQAEWTAAGLEEATYAVTLTVRDATGHAFSDRSLRFTDPIAGRDAVGSASYPDGGMRRLDAAFDLLGEDYPVSAVIDPAAGYAYFGTATSPGRVVKVALGSGASPPTRVGAVTLASGESYLWSAVIDPAAGYAWFGTGTYPAVW